MKIQQSDALSHLYFVGLMLLCVGLPLSKFLMSVSQFMLAGSWLFSFNYKDKLKSFCNNKLALILTGVFAIHLIGLLYSSDVSAGLKDIRIKLPLLILPFIMSTTAPLSRKQFDWLMAVFIAAVTIGTFCSMAVLLGFTKHVVTDIRGISIFISHIRFSLLICIAIFTLFYFAYNHNRSYSKITKALLLLLALWLIVFLFIMEAVTGILIFFSIGIFLLIYFSFKLKNIFLKIFLLGCIIGLPLTGYFFIKKVVTEFYKVNAINTDKLNPLTRCGKPYSHNVKDFDMENGHRLYLYVCDEELEAGWKKRSKMDYNGKDKKDQYLKYTLIRFLASKGLHKDADAINQLSEKEIRSIENGITNVNYQNISNIKSRVYQIIWEYNNYEHQGDPSGHSVMQRLEFWKAAMGIIEKNWIIGIGTGDVKEAFDAQYETMHSQLQINRRLHAHNQYLSIFVTFGIFGLIYFIVSLVYPLLSSRRYFDYFYFVFWCIAIMSMLTEDTLETQAGATFFAFFNSLFLFARPHQSLTNNLSESNEGKE